MKKIFKQSIDLFDQEVIRRGVSEVKVDSTVQEKNITFPMDRKLTEKVIEHCKRVARKEDIKVIKMSRNNVNCLIILFSCFAIEAPDQEQVYGSGVFI